VLLRIDEKDRADKIDESAETTLQLRFATQQTYKTTLHVKPSCYYQYRVYLDIQKTA
jgi:hypothetical protein